MFAFDPVAHCGAPASGQFCKTLTGTSPYSGWVEECFLLNAANHWVFDAFSDIQREVPFPLKGGSLRQRQEIHQQTPAHIVGQFLKINREKDKVKQPSGQEGSQAEAASFRPGFGYEEPAPFRLD
jgi:hypothetical protein